MIARLSRAAALVGGLLATAAAGQPATDAPVTCEGSGFDPAYFDYPRHQAEQWPQEARRAADNRANVERRDGHLRLRLEDGRTVELVDCPRTDTAHAYLYERYDEAGPFYVVQRLGYEDFDYALVMRKTGKRYTVAGLPIWTTDRVRFLTVGCAIARDQKTLSIHAPAGEGIATEAEIPLPCELESCAARWDNPVWISVSCTPYDDDTDRKKKGTEFVVLRGSDGVWKRFGR